MSFDEYSHDKTLAEGLAHLEMRSLVRLVSAIQAECTARGVNADLLGAPLSVLLGRLEASAR